MASSVHELSLDVRPTYVPKTISDFLAKLNSIPNVSEGLGMLDDFVKSLEEERTKIDAFKRELPLCMVILNEIIMRLKEEEIQYRAKHVEPVREFLPLTKRISDEDEAKKKENDSRDKMNWMSSVQLWNGDSNPNPNQQYSSALPIQVIGDEYPVVTGDPFQSGNNLTQPRALVPFQGCSVFPIAPPSKEEQRELPVPGLSLLPPGPGLSNAREEIGCSGLLSSKAIHVKPLSSSTPNGRSNLRPGPQSPQQQPSRKVRRCWSPELHRRFIDALEQLGGHQVATPKQIRDLMQVDGLTNDEVKSHLQKYRLHTRRMAPANAAAAAAAPAMNQPRPSFGDLWMTQNHQYGESSKVSGSQSGSPQGPFHLTGTSGGASTTGGESYEEEDEDARSVGYSWRSHFLRSGRDEP